MEKTFIVTTNADISPFDIENIVKQKLNSDYYFTVIKLGSN